MEISQGRQILEPQPAVELAIKCIIHSETMLAYWGGTILMSEMAKPSPNDIVQSMNGMLWTMDYTDDADARTADLNGVGVITSRALLSATTSTSKQRSRRAWVEPRTAVSSLSFVDRY